MGTVRLLILPHASDEELPFHLSFILLAIKNVVLKLK